MNAKRPDPITPAEPIEVHDEGDGGSVMVCLGDEWAIEIWPSGYARMTGSAMSPRPVGDLVTDVRRLLDAATAVHAGTWQE